LVAFELTVSGEPSEYDAQVLRQIATVVAQSAGVDTSAVTVTVRAGSVVLDISVATHTADAPRVQSAISQSIATPSAATAALVGVTTAQGSPLTVTQSSAVLTIANTPPTLPPAPQAMEPRMEDDLKDDHTAAWLLGAALLLIVVVGDVVVLLVRRNTKTKKRADANVRVHVGLASTHM